MNAPMVNEHIIVRQADLSDQSDRGQIDNWVLAHPQSTPFHRPQWLRAVEVATGNRAFMLVAENDAGQIVGLVPCHAIKSPLFGNALVSSGFAVGGGILAGTQGIADRLADSLWSLASEQRCTTAELRGGAIPLHGWTLQAEAHANFERALAVDDEAELLTIPRKQRAEVRKGLDGGLTIETGSGSRDLDWHYRIYSESVRNLGTPVFPRALMAQTLSAFGDDADILTVLFNGAPVASVLSLYHKGAVMPYWGGGTMAARRLRANDRMYFELMLHARRRGCARFDFGRSKTGSGAFDFKKNWGFEPQPLGYAAWTAPGAEARDADPTSAKHAARIALWKRLPLPVANLLGPHIARGLA